MVGVLPLVSSCTKIIKTEEVISNNTDSESNNNTLDSDNNSRPSSSVNNNQSPTVQPFQPSQNPQRPSQPNQSSTPTNPGHVDTNDEVDQPEEDPNATTFNSLTEINDYYSAYPDLVKYHDSSFPIDTQSQIIRDIYHNLFDRSFGFITEYEQGANSGGTLWLLDYKKIGNPSEAKYKLFFGTNYHVAVDLYRDDDQDIYKQTKRVNSNPLKTSAITFDVSRDNNKNVRDVVTRTKYKYKYARRFFKADKGFKIVFLGQNYMTQDAQPYGNGRNFYSDFAVLELDVDLNAAIPANEVVYRSPTDDTNRAAVQAQEKRQADIEWKLITEHIKNAIAAVDRSIQKFVNKPKNELWLTDGSIPYATVNYQTLRYLKEKYLLDPDGEQNYVTPITEPTLAIKNSTRLTELSNDIKKYIGEVNYNNQSQFFDAGFPYFVNRQVTETSTNLPTYTYPSTIGELPQRYPVASRKFILVNTDYNGNVIADHGTTFNEEQRSTYYGVVYEQPSIVQPIGGISGSLTINEQGLPIGLLFGDKPLTPVLDDNNRWINSYMILYAPFVQNVQYTTINSKNERITIYPYNLIDGTDKTKYPKQVHSYRERLIALYGPNYTTALFPNPK